MCSILGHFNTNLSLKEIEKYNKKLFHRGPDASIIKKYNFKNKKLFLAHNRLSIQDLSVVANQPMENEKYVIVFNGEIYNHFEIRKKLNFSNFQTHSDTETLLWAFTELGIEKTIDNLNGMFAIALFDKKEHKLYLIRDRVGIKPLYWYFKNDKFIFGSETKGFDVDKECDEFSLIKFLAFGYVGGDRSYYKDIKKLKPAHYLIFDGKTVKIKKYWDLPEEKINITYNEAVEEVECLLKKSIKKRLLADVEVGAFLSGGIDSSLVSSIMMKVSNTQIKTFTIGFDDKKYNEAKFAKEVADYIGSKHFEYYFTSNDVLNLIDKLDYYYDEPFGDASALPTMLLSKITKSHVTVALSGDGGDELFLGYERYFWTQNYYNKLSKIPLRGLFSFVCKNINNDKCQKIAYPIKHLTKENLYSILSTAIKPWEVSKVLNKDYVYTLSQLSEYDKKLDTIEDFSRFDFYNYLPDDILVKVDRASMAYSLEARVPILDHKIVEFAYSLPENIKLFNGTKAILKEILYKYVPKTLIDRPKKGFGVPLKYWFRNELKDILFDKINSLDERFNKKYILELFDKHQKGYNYEYILWNLMRAK